MLNVYVVYALILLFHDFHLGGQTNMAYYNYFFKHPFRQDIFKQTYRHFVFRDYILTLALYSVHTRVSTHVVS